MMEEDYKTDYCMKEESESVKVLQFTIRTYVQEVDAM